MSRPHSISLSLHFLLGSHPQRVTPERHREERASGPADREVAWRRCAVGTLDLAALEDGQLSEPGMQRLSHHLADCDACRAVLTALLHDAEQPEGTGSHRIQTWPSPQWTTAFPDPADSADPA